MTIDDVNVVYIALPAKVKGITTENEDGSFTIFIDKDLSSDQQRETYLHEMDHIASGDLRSILSADQIEKISYGRI